MIHNQLIEDRLLTSIKNIRAFVPEKNNEYTKYSLLLPEDKKFQITIPSTEIQSVLEGKFPFTYAIKREVQYQDLLDIDTIIKLINSLTNASD